MISPHVIHELLTVRQVLHYLPASPKTEKGWTAREQQLFWEALTQFPQGPWTTIAEFIGTKSTRQAMTHGQKLRQKLNRWRKRLRRTPAAAAALAEDPQLLDDDHDHDGAHAVCEDNVSANRQMTQSLSYDLDAIAVTSSGLAAADANYTELLMSSFSAAPAGISPFTDVFYGAAATATEATDAGVFEPPLFYSPDERYAIPQAMADDLADVLWGYEHLDVFRGATLCLMVFVNYGGGGFALFTHSAWDGMTVADLVFPFFAWIMGFGIFLTAYNNNHLSKANHAADWSHWRIPGVLQALSVAFLVVGTMNTVFPPPVQGSEAQRRWTRFLLTHALLGLLPLVALNLSVTFLLPVPGCPTGYLGPGGTADGGKYQNCTGGAHLYVDTLVFGRSHIYQAPTCQAQFHTGAYDPEGALNWLMVAVATYLGYFSAVLVVVFSASVTQKANALVAIGALLAALSVVSGGALVTQTPWVPLNKNLWSVSYVLLSAAVACWVYALLLAVVDGEARAWAGWPLLSVGKNSIFVYFLHEVFESWAPFSPRAIHAEDGFSQLTWLLFNAVGVLRLAASGCGEKKPQPPPQTDDTLAATTSVDAELRVREVLWFFLNCASGNAGFERSTNVEHWLEKPLEALLELAPPRCHAVRDGATVDVLVKELVPGDIAIVGVVDCVPADVGLLETVDLEVDESSLTNTLHFMLDLAAESSQRLCAVAATLRADVDPACVPGAGDAALCLSRFL
ncbi:hypothetical protein PybrP1_013091 [[Pythium] brassicae (nom. inval.)]|nr:hypothetical protein PybrP1_013091 [[Pythium] brassicae (nom. inval.)]